MRASSCFARRRSGQLSRPIVLAAPKSHSAPFSGFQCSTHQIESTCSLLVRAQVAICEPISIALAKLHDTHAGHELFIRTSRREITGEGEEEGQLWSQKLCLNFGAKTSGVLKSGDEEGPIPSFDRFSRLTHSVLPPSSRSSFSRSHSKIGASLRVPEAELVLLAAQLQLTQPIGKPVRSFHK